MCRNLKDAKEDHMILVVYFQLRRRFYSKGEVKVKCARGCWSQITPREEGEKATFEATVAFELLSQ